ncbi:hypothetical protein LCGC14_1893880 [marine sediment metagenome]|uniref:Uncharacterized protein n=1 Tax=marine sediment metagenome TaxID=412755 RepID=A0A0F9FYX6_9ZZZZ
MGHGCGPRPKGPPRPRREQLEKMAAELDTVKLPIWNPAKAVHHQGRVDFVTLVLAIVEALDAKS